MIAHRWLLPFAFAGLAAVQVTVAQIPVAQSPATKAQIAQPTAHGRVVDQHGAPVAGAEVTLTTAIHPYLAIAPAEVVRTVTDATGTFRAPVRAHHGYSAFAIGPAAADGRRLATSVTTSVVSGQFTTLTAAPCAPSALLVQGLPAWGAAAPRRGRILLSRAVGAEFGFAIDADGTAWLPPLPADRLGIELLDADGGVVWHTWTEPTATIALPEPYDLELVALDEKGAALAGVAFDQRTAVHDFTRRGLFERCRSERWRRLGVSGADGKASVRIAQSGDPAYVLRARLPGRADGLLMMQRDRMQARLGFQLRPATPWRGQLRSGRAPLADTLVHVELMYQRSMNGGLPGEFELLYPTRTDGRGDFVVADAPDDPRLGRLLLPPGTTAGKGATLPPVLIESATPAVAFTEVSLTALPTVDLQVLRPDGGPAESAIVVVVPLDRPRFGIEVADQHLRLDRAGRARFCQPCGKCLVFCTDGLGSAHAWTEDRNQRLQLKLEPLASMTVRCVDPAGAPRPGAALKLFAYGTGGSGENALDAIAWSMQQWLPESVRTDAAGEAVVRCLPFVADKLCLQFWSAGAVPNLVMMRPGEHVVLPLPAAR